MKRKLLLFIFLFYFIGMLFVNIGYLNDAVYIEFLYHKPCSVCPGMEEYYLVYLHDKKVINNIQTDYEEKIIVEWIDFSSSKGRERREEYGLADHDWNTIVVNREIILLGGDKFVNETDLREIIDSYLAQSYIHNIAIVEVTSIPSSVFIGEEMEINVTIKNNGNYIVSFNVTIHIDSNEIESFSVEKLEPGQQITLSFNWEVPEIPNGRHILSAKVYFVQGESYNNTIIEVKDPSLSTFVEMAIMAFSFGFFETFSPCLIIMLSFIVGYTLSDNSIKFKEGFIKVMVFGIGFVLASAILGLVCGLIFFSMPNLHFSIMLIVCAFAILFGLNLLGLLKFPIQTKPFLSKMAKKYVIRYVGIFLLGFVFYFLDPCIAPVFISMTTILFTDMLFLVLLIFCIGALIPFFGIGISVGSISRLSRKVYKHRFVIRGLSGVILIGYALYLILHCILFLL